MNPLLCGSSSRGFFSNANLLIVPGKLYRTPTYPLPQPEWSRGYLSWFGVKICLERFRLFTENEITAPLISASRLRIMKLCENVTYPLISGGSGSFQCLEESGVSPRKRGVLKQHLSTKTQRLQPEIKFLLVPDSLFSIQAPFHHGLKMIEMKKCK